MTLPQATLPDRNTAARGKRAPNAYVSLLSPAGRRRLWWYLYNCPVCRMPQLGRARHLADVAGPRRGGCGHQLVVVIARTYGRPGSGTAA
jgi:hypothetical protein